MIGDFKNATKYAVERKFDGERVRIVHEDGAYRETPGFDPDSHELPQLAEARFAVEAWVVGSEIHVSDLLQYDGEDMTDEPWHRRYLTLKKEFDWERPVYLSKHLVVQDEEAFHDALELYAMLPHSAGAVVKPYHSEYDDEGTYYVPAEEITDE